MNPSPECFAIVPEPSFTMLYAWVKIFHGTQMSSSRQGCSRRNSRQLSPSVTSLSPAQVLSVPSEPPGWAKAVSKVGHWGTNPVTLVIGTTVPLSPNLPIPHSCQLLHSPSSRAATGSSTEWLFLPAAISVPPGPTLHSSHSAAPQSSCKPTAPLGPGWAASPQYPCV